LGLARAVVEDVFFDEEAVVVCVRPRAREQRRCPVCRRRCPSYDRGDGRRRWRAMDLGTTFAYVEAQAPRVLCRRHGIIVAAVPWARHDSWFTTGFEDQCAWLAVNTSASAVAQLMRTTWRAVGGICRRVADEARGQRDLLAGLSRIGVDEISVRKGQRYLTVVVDHDTGRLVWAAPGRDRKTVEKFLDLLGEDRCAEIELVSCDMAAWISGPVAERCPGAEICLDPFHVVKLATDALDEIRREVWNEARRAGEVAVAKDLKGARFALWKNPENLTPRQTRKLAQIQKVNQRLYRAYLLKEQLRQIYRRDPDEAIGILDAWLKWAWRCRLGPFVKLARTIRDQRAGIEAAIRNGISNARVEQVNTQIRLITRRGFGYHSQEAVIALAMLKLGGLCPPLPGR
jgi:transposase